MVNKELYDYDTNDLLKELGLWYFFLNRN
jgi:hypothetical protein